MNVRTFSTAAVLSAIYGRLLCPLADLYDVLTYLIGRSVYTHELGSAGKLACPHVIEQHPAFAGLSLDHIAPENWKAELAILERQLGTEIVLSPMGWNALADKTPLDTLKEMVDQDKIIVVETGHDD